MCQICSELRKRGKIGRELLIVTILVVFPVVSVDEKILTYVGRTSELFPLHRCVELLSLVIVSVPEIVTMDRII